MAYTSIADPKRRKIDGKDTMTYTAQRVLGKGSFGVVYQAQVLETNEIVAIKSIKVQQKDREIQILKELGDHPNIVCLKGAFFSNEATSDGKTEQKLNLVLEFLSDTLHRVIKHYNTLNQTMNILFVSLYTYQLLRGLAFIHGKGIMHCDIKPQNLLLNGAMHTVKLCDFGTAKRVASGELLRPYICSRFYRAPELIVGCTNYTTAIDLWSAGCVLGEMILGKALFTGSDGINQLVEIIKVLGTPTSTELKAMNPHYPSYEFSPKLGPHAWQQVFRGATTDAMNDLAGKLMCYDPAKRIPPMQALLHKCFSDLRDSNNDSYAHLFDFSEEELWWCPRPDRHRLIPAWCRNRAVPA